MINIKHGIYDIMGGNAFYRDGFHNKESKTYMSMPSKFTQLLRIKGIKFWKKYNELYIPFTYGIDIVSRVEAIAICHIYYDYPDDAIGEDIVVGRIRRMRGDLGRAPYDLTESIYDKKGHYIRLKYPYINMEYIEV